MKVFRPIVAHLPSLLLCCRMAASWMLGRGSPPRLVRFLVLGIETRVVIGKPEVVESHSRDKDSGGGPMSGSGNERRELLFTVIIGLLAIVSMMIGYITMSWFARIGSARCGLRTLTPRMALGAFCTPECRDGQRGAAAFRGPFSFLRIATWRERKSHMPWFIDRRVESRVEAGSR